MPAPALFALPYHVARTPLAVLDMTVVSRLSENSPVRRGFEKAFGSLDLIAGRVFADQSLLRQGAERMAAGAPARPARPAADRQPARARPTGDPASTGSANGAAPAEDLPENIEDAGPAAFGPAPAAKKAARKRPAPAARPGPDGEAPQAAQAREDVLTKRQPGNTRSNKNLSTIRRELAETEAIAEAHEHLAEERAEERDSSDS